MILGGKGTRGKGAGFCRNNRSVSISCFCYARGLPKYNFVAYPQKPSPQLFSLTKKAVIVSGTLRPMVTFLIFACLCTFDEGSKSASGISLALLPLEIQRLGIARKRLRTAVQKKAAN